MLVDINMPKMNGFDFCVKVFEVDINPKVCFIVISTNKSRSIKRAVSIIEYWLFYRKPITMDSLIRRVKAELE